MAVLDAAFEGLTRAKDNAEANLQNARELFSQSADALFSSGNEDEIGMQRLGSITTRLTNGYVGPTRDIYVEQGIPYLLARHVRDNRLTFDGRTHITPEFNEKNKKSKLCVDDVVLVQSGHIGHCAVIPAKHAGHNCHAMIVLTTVKDHLSGKYLSAVLNTPHYQDEFQTIRTGSTVPHLTCKLVKEMMIPVPSLERQAKVVEQIDLLRSHYDNLAENYRSKITDIADLRQSLLQKSFAGELT